MRPHGGVDEIAATMVKQLFVIDKDSDDACVPRLLERIVATLRAEESGALAVMFFGSLARGAAGPFSDIDLRVITEGEPAIRDRVRFVNRPDGGILHLSIGARPKAEIIATASDPESWAWMIHTY